MTLRYRLIATFIVVAGLTFMIASTTTAAPREKWYEGGTLHKAGALDWQKATYRDKLATCADFVAYAWEKGMLKTAIRRKIKTIEDFRPYAIELLKFLDAALEKDPDPAKNQKMYAKLMVSEIAAIGMATMGWVKE